MNLNLQEEYKSFPYTNPDAYVQQSMELPVTLELSELIPEDDISRTVIRCTEESGVIRYLISGNRDCDDFSSINMLKAVCLACTIAGQPSLREMADMAKNDIRFRLIFQDDRTPSFMAFQRFISNDMKCSLEILLTTLNRYMASQLPEDINPEYEEIDGTKEEADANKMTFVWRKATEKYRSSLFRKAYGLIEQLIPFFNQEKFPHSLSILRVIDLSYLMETALLLERYASDRNIQFVQGKGCRKNQIQRWYEKIKDYALRIWKYEMHFDILEDRNSFSKTDPDATFMHMKYDYYNHTNVFKPGYNVQVGSVNGFIWDVYISADCNDMRTYIPFMEQHYRSYGSYPKYTPADAGYGSYDNYKFCRDNGIELYMKYSGYEARKEKVTDKNRFKSYTFDRDKDGMPVCPAGHSFRIEKTRTETRGIYPREMETLINDHCEDCPLKAKCTKAKNGIRKINRCVQLEEWQEEVNQNLESDLGKKLMKDRQIFSEGLFGDKKYNWRSSKMRRIGESGVKTEFYLFAIGKNMRRFHRIYWNRYHEAEKKSKELIAFARSVIPKMA